MNKATDHSAQKNIVITIEGITVAVRPDAVFFIQYGKGVHCYGRIEERRNETEDYFVAVDDLSGKEFAEAPTVLELAFIIAKLQFY